MTTISEKIAWRAYVAVTGIAGDLDGRTGRRLELGERSRSGVRLLHGLVRRRDLGVELGDAGDVRIGEVVTLLAQFVRLGIQGGELVLEVHF